MDLHNKIEKYKQYPLADSEIEKLSGYKLITYPELYKYETLEHLLHMNNGSVIIMYLQNNAGTYGHYTVLNKISPKVVEHFDPYGLFVDKQLKFSNNQVNEKFKQDSTYLSYLLTNSPYTISYNHHKFQQMTPPTQTCGWHCCLRMRNKNLTLNQYKKMMDDGVKELKQNGLPNANYDSFVVVSLYPEVFNTK
jgi:hypothetical protein